MTIDELTPTRVAEFRVAIRTSDKKAREVLKFLNNVRMTADIEWDPEYPTHVKYYDRLDRLTCLARERLLLGAIMKKEALNG